MMMHFLMENEDSKEESSYLSYSGENRGKQMSSEDKSSEKEDKAKDSKEKEDKEKEDKDKEPKEKEQKVSHSVVILVLLTSCSYAFHIHNLGQLYFF